MQRQCVPAADEPRQARINMAQLTCEAKVDVVADYVECLVLSGVRFLLFAHHHTMLDALEARLSKLHTCHIRIDGSTSSQHRAERVARFQSGSDVQVALLSITACGQGLNLQCASTVIFAELHWVVGQILQAEDRVHRFGQTSAVNVQYLIAPGTLDDVMYETLKRKHLDTTATLDGQRQALRVERGSVSTARNDAKPAVTLLDLWGPHSKAHAQVASSEEGTDLCMDLSSAPSGGA